MISKSNWEISIDIKTLKALFEDNYDEFTNMAGDMETLVFNCKLEHSTRVFCLDDSYKNKISSSDLVCAIQVLKKNRKIVNIVTERDEYAMRTMYS